MKILLVMDQYYGANNGATISARRFAGVLMAHGHEVRVACTAMGDMQSQGERAYLMRKQYIPIFDHLVTAQGMTFSKPDDALLEEAISWADVTHFLLPFTMSRHGIRICKRLGKPYTAAFHVQPENVSSSLHLGNVKFVNDGIYAWYNHYIYKECAHIHCPSRFIAGELKKHGYKGKLHVISNGIDPDFTYRKMEKPAAYADKFIILMIGRLSIEKRQDVLIRAIKLSRHADRLTLVLAGKGPRKKQLQRLIRKLEVPATIRFFEKKDLLDMIAMSDLYVHAANMEIEAMSCMEAFAGGLVPVIANSPKSATPQFALDERSLFRAGDPQDLARKIDYWVEHEDERKKMEHAYSALGKKYDLDTCVRQAEEMFREAMREV